MEAVTCELSCTFNLFISLLYRIRTTLLSVSVIPKRRHKELIDLLGVTELTGDVCVCVCVEVFWSEHIT